MLRRTRKANVLLGCCLLIGWWSLRGGAAAQAQPVAADTVEVVIRAVEGLQFTPLRFAVAPGVPVKLRFENRDGSGMQHNLLVTRPGAREEVVEVAMALGAAGPARQYVPDTPLVLHATPLLDQDDVYTLTFDAPETPGVYPYVCTFPGHGLVMYGALYVGTPMPALAADDHVPPAARAHAGAAPADVAARPKVYRYLMPDAGPAAVAVALPGDQNYCWDAGAGRLRYAWRGGFVDRTESLFGGNGREMQRPARLLGTVYYRAGDAYPLRIGTGVAPPAVDFTGYRLVEGMPEFRYTVDGVPVREYITPSPDGEGLARRFEVGPTRGPVYFVATQEAGVDVQASAGTWEEDGVLRLTAEEAARFTLTMTPTETPRGTR